MRKRRDPNRKYGGHILDAPSSVDEQAWENDTLLTPLKAAKDAPACRCPSVNKTTYLGGCQPGLMFTEAGKLQAICRVCLKDLDPKTHKRAQQRWVINLATAYNSNPGHVDLESISDLFVTGGSPPASILE